MQTLRMERLELDSGTKVLDVGCGDGRHLRAALENHHAYGVGVDLSAERVREAYRKFWIYPLTGRGTLVQSDLFCLPFRAGSFDVVVCSEVLEHLPEFEPAVTELTRVLTPGGRLGVSVPNYLPEKICWKLDDRYSSISGHRRIFHPEDIVESFRDAGFTLLESETMHALHTPFWWLVCLSGDIHLAEHPEDLPSWLQTGGDGERDEPAGWFWDWLRSDPKYPSRTVSLYMMFLEWYEEAQPRMLRSLEKALNPCLGYSRTFYFQKGPARAR